MQRSKSSNASASSAASEEKEEIPLQAVLLADSFTTTFRPASLEKPKVLCPLNNVPMLDYSIEFMARSGVAELFVFCVHLADVVEEYVSKSAWKSHMKVTCVKEKQCTKAGDALRHLDKLGLVRSDPFLLMSGDVVTNCDVREAIADHKARKKADSSSIMTVLFMEVGENSALRPVSADLVVALNTSGQVVLFEDDHGSNSVSLPSSFFDSHGEVIVRSDLFDCGLYVCSPEVLSRFSDEVDYNDIRTQFIRNHVAEEDEGMQSKIFSHLLQPSEYAARVHDFRTYAAVSRDLLRRRCYPLVPDSLPAGYARRRKYVMERNFVYREALGRTSVGRDAQLEDGTLVGSDCVVGDKAVVRRSVLGDNCAVGSGANVCNSFLWEGVVVERNARVDGAVLCDGCTVKEGARVGRGCVVGQGCVVERGVILPDFTRITGHIRADDDEEDDDWGSDDDDDSDEEGDRSAPFDLAQAQSIGFDALAVYTKRLEAVTKWADDQVDGEVTLLDGTLYDDVGAGGSRGGAGSSHARSPSLMASSSPIDVIIGRQKGIDVVLEMSKLCLEHDKSQSIINLSIELNSFKFSQNATFSDCNNSVVRAAVEIACKAKEVQAGNLSLAKAVGIMKKEFTYWKDLFNKLSPRKEDQLGIMVGLEEMCSGSTPIGAALSKDGGFRLVLQTLFDMDAVSEDGVLKWAEKRRAGEGSAAALALFKQPQTQNFLEWLEEEEESESEEDDEDE